MAECVLTFWKDDIDSWHASCSEHRWASTDGNFNRGEVEYIAEVHRHQRLTGRADGGA